MPTFKPAYLIHGDDHGRIAERRARLRALAEAESGAAGLEVFEGDQCVPDVVAGALNAMTFALGRRFIIADGVERWRDKDLDLLIEAMRTIPPETTVALFGREDSRAKAPARLREAVANAGGDVSVESNVKPWELSKWVIARGRELGLILEPDAARALVEQVGDRQQRLLRELEKLALALDEGAQVEVSQIEAMTAPSAERRAWSLADALVAGEAEGATRLYLALRAQGERVPGLLYWISQRLRLAHEVARSVDTGEPVSQVKRRLRMPSRAADRLIADARRAGVGKLRTGVEELADLEVASRGGGKGVASEDTAALRAIQRITS